MKIRRCVVCKAYTLKLHHCGKMTVKAHPPKFKHSDKYLRLRGEC